MLGQSKSPLLLNLCVNWGWLSGANLVRVLPTTIRDFLTLLTFKTTSVSSDAPFAISREIHVSMELHCSICSQIACNFLYQGSLL
jgi:hypothetical protein